MGDQAQQLAESAARAMFERDDASRALGMELLHVGPGTARMRMTVRSDMINGHKTAHGGFIFTLADSTFAFACNSHDKPAVAASCLIDFLKPAWLGDVLTASGDERALSGRNGVYDIRIENQRGELIALFRGKSVQIKGSVTGGPGEFRN
ncbi:MAG: hydroxyphenylacetyl-CoA thioesterase PaaI [Betaproteobacteria bacterium]|nr:hydroxyphenylacetyl-CoA thioesterase PaaI [Betaproteobacteria bacterium]